MINNELLNRCTKAIESSRNYLISVIEKHTLYDQWYGTSVPPPVERSASPMLVFFAASALQKSGGIPESIKCELTNILDLAKKGGSYGYDSNAPIDADDTAFALRARIVLGESVTPDMVANALEPFQCNDSWFTFQVKTDSTVTPPFHTHYQGPQSALGPHPEVHLNILALFQEAGGGDALRIPSLPQKNDLPVCYFYNSALYGAWLFSTLCRGMQLEYESIRSAVLQLRSDDGSWACREHGFSAVEEASLGLLSLNTFSTPDKYKHSTLTFILGQQKDNGSFPGGTLWNHRLPVEQKDAYWYAKDIMSIVSTSFVILAVGNSIINDGIKRA